MVLYRFEKVEKLAKINQNGKGLVLTFLLDFGPFFNFLKKV